MSVRITIEKALKLRSFCETAKKNKSTFGMNCILLLDELNEKLKPFQRKEFDYKLRVGVKSERGFLFSPEAEIAMANWFELNTKAEIEVNQYITEDITPIDDSLEFVMLCNGILCQVDINDFISK